MCIEYTRAIRFVQRDIFAPVYTSNVDPVTISTPLSVWIVEDHESYREIIQSLVADQDGMICSGAFADCESMLEALTPVATPDVVLMDISLPGMTGIHGVLEIKKRAPHVAVVMLTVHGDNDKIFDAICAGAKGYLLKTAPLPSIIAAIREAKEGGTVLSPKIARRVLNMFAQQNRSKLQDFDLTPREVEVLEHCKTGKTKKEIADLLCLSVHTVDSHTRNIYEKLEVNSRAALMEKLYSNGS